MKKSRAGIIIVLFLGTAFVWGAIFTGTETEPFVEVIFFDVGQGDAAMVKAPQAIQILIDGGPSGAFAEKVLREMPLFDRNLELVVLTHPHKDHIVGLFEVFEVFEVERVLMPNMEGEKEEKEIYDRFKKVVEEEKSEVIFAKKGQKIFFSDEIYFLVFWPPPEESNEIKVIKDTNDFSVVGKLVFNKVSFLFTGDISERVEKVLSLEGDKIKSEVLKVAHHGSKYSTSDNFLNIVRPLVAVICVGKNSYGHPTKEVLERLEKYDIKTFRTDNYGDIKIISDGQTININ